MIKFSLLMMLTLSCAKLDVLTLEKEKLIPFPEFEKITFAPRETTDFEISEVIDARIDKDYVGEALIGVYFEKTPVALYKDTSSFFKDYFYSSLNARNFHLVSSSETKAQIIINKLAVYEVIEKFKPERAKCEIDITLNMKNSQSESSIKLWTTIISKGNLGDGTKKIAPTLASCLNEVVERLVVNKTFYKFI